MTVQFEVPGRAGYIGVPMVLLPLLAMGAALYFQQTLPGFHPDNVQKIFTVIAGVEVPLLGFLLFLRARRVTLDGAMIRYRSWFASHAVAAAEVTDLTVERELGGGSNDVVTLDRLIAFWVGRGTPLRLNLRYWDHEALRRLLSELLHRNPRIQLGPEVRAFMQPMA